MVSLTVPNTPMLPANGLRPVNLRTDLAPLADLIELAFSDTMDTSGRAAVREMRALSRIGPGLNVLAGMNDLTQGVSLGFVYMQDGRLVGNVSVYPANMPNASGSAWIIANVAVHPDYRRRGIARELMNASMAMIRQRGGTTAVLQVDANNDTAHRLYQQLGFVSERAWTYWRRGSTGRVPQPLQHRLPIITRRRGDWRAEYQLAERLRPAARGGLGWLRPLHMRFFRQPFWSALTDFFTLRSTERLVIHADDDRALVASLWIDNGFAASSVQLALMVEPAYQGLYDDALLNLAVRRFGTRSPITIDHPADETVTSAIIEQYHFRPLRTLIHMRWDVGR